MLKIGICDDEEQFAWELEGYLLQYAEKNGIRVDVQVFAKADGLVCHIEKQGIFDILFLDIELGKMTGVELAKALRADLKNEMMQIVFVSAKQNYAMQLFDIRPFNFLVKPIGYEEVEHVMNEYGRLYPVQPNYFEYRIGKQIMKINDRVILYFQSRGKKIKIVTQDGEREFYGKLSEVTAQLNDRYFCPVHKSFVVNMQYVSEYRLESIQMANGEEVPVSRSMRGYVSEKIMENERGM